MSRKGRSPATGRGEPRASGRLSVGLKKLPDTRLTSASSLALAGTRPVIWANLDRTSAGTSIARSSSIVMGAAVGEGVLSW